MNIKKVSAALVRYLAEYSKRSEVGFADFKVTCEENKILFWIETVEGVQIDGKIKVRTSSTDHLRRRYKLTKKALEVILKYGMKLGADIELRV